jgi:hypothetical protein
MLGNYAGEPQASRRQHIATPAYASQAFNRFGVAHPGISVGTVC